MKKIICLSIFLAIFCFSVFSDEVPVETAFDMFFDKNGTTLFYIYELTAPSTEVYELVFPLYEEDKWSYEKRFGVHVEIYETTTLNVDLVFSSSDVINSAPGNMMTSDTLASGSSNYPVLNFSAHVDSGNNITLSNEEITSRSLSIDRRTLPIIDNEEITRASGNKIKDYTVTLELNAPKDEAGKSYFMEGYYKGYVILNVNTL